MSDISSITGSEKHYSDNDFESDTGYTTEGSAASKSAQPSPLPSIQTAAKPAEVPGPPKAEDKPVPVNDATKAAAQARLAHEIGAMSGIPSLHSASSSVASFSGTDDRDRPRTPASGESPRSFTSMAALAMRANVTATPPSTPATAAAPVAAPAPLSTSSPSASPVTHNNGWTPMVEPTTPAAAVKQTAPLRMSWARLVNLAVSDPNLRDAAAGVTASSPVIAGSGQRSSQDMASARRSGTFTPTPASVAALKSEVTMLRRDLQQREEHIKKLEDQVKTTAADLARRQRLHEEDTHALKEGKAKLERDLTDLEARLQITLKQPAAEGGQEDAAGLTQFLSERLKVADETLDMLKEENERLTAELVQARSEHRMEKASMESKFSNIKDNIMENHYLTSMMDDNILDVTRQLEAERAVSEQLKQNVVELELRCNTAERALADKVRRHEYLLSPCHN